MRGGGNLLVKGLKVRLVRAVVGCQLLLLQQQGRDDLVLRPQQLLERAAALLVPPHLQSPSAVESLSADLHKHMHADGGRHLMTLRPMATHLLLHHVHFRPRLRRTGGLGLCPGHLYSRPRLGLRGGTHLGVDVKVILTQPCIFCIDNH